MATERMFLLTNYESNQFIYSFDTSISESRSFGGSFLSREVVYFVLRLHIKSVEGVLFSVCLADKLICCLAVKADIIIFETFALVPQL